MTNNSVEAKWLQTGLGNIVEYVCRAARAVTRGDWEQARLEQLYAWRAGVTIELEAIP